jgi:uncharacterized membrane protein
MKQKSVNDKSSNNKNAKNISVKTARKSKAEKDKYAFINKMHPTSRIPLTRGQKAADKLTRVAGSWGFIIGFLIFIIAWMIFNTAWLVFGNAWDSYPFILLNLALSCLAAIQAPVILMSQNRSAERDRVRAQYDYAVNVKAENEIEDIKHQLNRIEEHMMKRRN